MLILYTFLCFSDIVPDPETRFEVGYFCCFFVSLHFIFNLFMILAFSVKDIKLKSKRRKWQNKRK